MSSDHHASFLELLWSLKDLVTSTSSRACSHTALGARGGLGLRRGSGMGLTRPSVTLP